MGMNVTTEQWKGKGEENVIKATYPMKTMKQTCKIKNEKGGGEALKNTALIKLVVHILVLLYNKSEVMLINRTNRFNSKTAPSVES